MYADYTDEYAFARNYLTPGEAVLWKGKPVPGHLVSREDIIMIPFSILWCGFAIFWEDSVISTGAPFIFKLWGIPFVCMGLYLVFGRFIWMAYIRKRTRYVVTNRKIIRMRGNRVDMLDAKSLPPMHMTAWADGSGTIRFGQDLYYRRGRYGAGAGYSRFSLENVPDVARVHGILSGMDR